VRDGSGALTGMPDRRSAERLRTVLIWCCWLAVVVASVAWVCVEVGFRHPNFADLAVVIGLLVPLVGGPTLYELLHRRGDDVDVLAVAERLAKEVARQERVAHDQLTRDPQLPIRVSFEHVPSGGRDARHAQREGTADQAAAYYRGLWPRRLVVTGEAGSGKTVLAIKLILGLLEHRDPTDQIPVRFALSGWRPDVELSGWLVDQLAIRYRIRPRDARELLTAGLVLPVLDGLDEMDPADTDPISPAPRAAALLDALNTYQAGELTTRHLVLTSRASLYDRLSEQGSATIVDSAHVRIRPLTSEAAADYLSHRTNHAGRWDLVCDRLLAEPASPLAVMLSTPWRLNLAFTVYEAGDPGELLASASADQLYRSLLDRYVWVVTEQDGRYQPERVAIWLRTLATYLMTNAVTERMVGGRPLSGTEIEPHRLWPLAGARRLRRLEVGLSLPLAALAWYGALRAAQHVPPRLSQCLLVVTWLLLAVAASAVPVTWPAPRHLAIWRGRAPAETAGLVIGGILAAAFAGFLASVALSPFALPLAAPLGVLGLSLVASEEPRKVSRLPMRERVRLRDRKLTVSQVPGQLISPRDALRGELRLALACGSAYLLTLVVVWVVAVRTGRATAGNGGWASLVVLGLAGWLLVLLAVAALGRRYLALLLCTRGRLPWRLGAFLDWALDVGLLRRSGARYEFRHRELLEYLSGEVRGEAPRPRAERRTASAVGRTVAGIVAGVWPRLSRRVRTGVAVLAALAILAGVGVIVNVAVIAVSSSWPYLAVMRDTGVNASAAFGASFTVPLNDALRRGDLNALLRLATPDARPAITAWWRDAVVPGDAGSVFVVGDTAVTLDSYGTGAMTLTITDTSEFALSTRPEVTRTVHVTLQQMPTGAYRITGWRPVAGFHYYERGSAGLIVFGYQDERAAVDQAFTAARQAADYDAAFLRRHGAAFGLPSPLVVFVSANPARGVAVFGSGGASSPLTTALGASVLLNTSGADPVLLAAAPAGVERAALVNAFVRDALGMATQPHNTGGNLPTWALTGAARLVEACYLGNQDPNVVACDPRLRGWLADLTPSQRGTSLPTSHAQFAKGTAAQIIAWTDLEASFYAYLAATSNLTTSLNVALRATLHTTDPFTEVPAGPNGSTLPATRVERSWRAWLTTYERQ
jgi:hypothetical protein